MLVNGIGVIDHFSLCPTTVIFISKIEINKGATVLQTANDRP
jgi:hypothetical protein